MGGEADELALIPRSVRDKLDRVGVKLHLREWEELERAERRELVERACDSADEVRLYRDYLVRVVRRRSGKEPDRLTS